MHGLPLRDFYKRKNYESLGRYLLGMLLVTVVLIPVGLFMKLIHKIWIKF